MWENTSYAAPSARASNPSPLLSNREEDEKLHPLGEAFSYAPRKNGVVKQYLNFLVIP